MNCHKHSYRWLLFLLLLLPDVVTAGHLVLQQVNQSVYVFVTFQNYEGVPFPANGVYVLTSAGAVLVDAPWDTTQVLPLIDSIRTRHHVPVIACIATHFHEDRTGSIDVLKRLGIPTWSSAMTRELCHKEGFPEAENTFLNDTSFVFGDTKLQTFYPGKGHAPDNIVVWLDKYKILIGGCFVKSVESTSLGNLSHADVKAWPESVRKTMQKFPDPDFVIPGHFGWLQHHSLEHTLKLLRKHKA